MRLSIISPTIPPRALGVNRFSQNQIPHPLGKSQHQIPTYHIVIRYVHFL